MPVSASLWLHSQSASLLLAAAAEVDAGRELSKYRPDSLCLTFEEAARYICVCAPCFALLVKYTDSSRREGVSTYVSVK